MVIVRSERMPFWGYDLAARYDFLPLLENVWVAVAAICGAGISNSVQRLRDNTSFARFQTPRPVLRYVRLADILASVVPLFTNAGRQTRWARIPPLRC